MLLENPDLIEAKRVVIPLSADESFKKESARENKKDSEYFNDEKPERIYENWQRLEGFDTSIELLAFFDPQINNGTVILHPWQIDTGESLCRVKSTSLHPHKFALCAANGSGKDAFIIAPFSLWFILTKIRSRVIITSSSGVQLTNQTEAYISGLAERINNWSLANLGAFILKVNKRHIVCNLSGSEIILFATDEEGKAEGYHPLEPNSEMAIIVNEAKSVAPEIFRALRRCTGFNYWINVSTPGAPIGDFYKSFINWPNKKRVTFFDCPHQSRDEFDEDLKELGEFNPHFRSKWLALFTFIDGKYVLSHERLEKLRNKVKLNFIKSFGNEIRIGIDIALSTNGDESVVSIFKGNKQIKQKTCRIKDATLLADFIDKELSEAKIPKDHPYIYGDDGGVGRAVIDILRKKKWMINRVLNQSAAKNKKQFRNRGAEIWSKFSRLVEEGVIILLDDDKLYSQLASRKYKESTAGIDKLCLQSKLEMIAEGINSPDRADAAVLAFSNIKVLDFLDQFIEDESVKVEKDSTKMTPEEIEEQITWNGMKLQRRKKTNAHGSLSIITGHKTKKNSKYNYV
ncbi:MAG TPA: hypothetical protein VF849_00030 [Blattabacteriaceae bacterium]